MRKFLLVAAVTLLGSLALGACSNKGGTETTATTTEVTRPTAGAVEAEIQKCLKAHPGAAPAAASSSAPASGSSAPSLASSQASSGENPCDRATLAASVWQAYMQKIVGANMGTIANAPFAYFVPSGKYPENAGAVSRVQDSLAGTVAATVLAGNLIAVGGPDSATTAQVVELAFKQASPGSFKGVTVLFMGDQADAAAVKAAIAPSGATFKFAQM